jgi:glycosyltransferase involved in cell wall biosynthesis
VQVNRKGPGAPAQEGLAISGRKDVGKRGSPVVRAIRRVRRMWRRFRRDPGRVVRTVKRKLLRPLLRRFSSFLVRHAGVPSVRDQRKLPDTSIVALLDQQDLDRLLTAPYGHDTELVLLADGRDRDRAGRWIRAVRARVCRLYLFERSRSRREMLRYGLSRATGMRVVVHDRRRALSHRALAPALARLPEDPAAFVDAGNLLVLGQGAVNEAVTDRDVRDDLAKALADVIGEDSEAAGNERVGVFFYARGRHGSLADRLLASRAEFDRTVVYGRDPGPLLELLQRQGDDAVPGLEVVDARQMPGAFVYRAPPGAALFAQPAERDGIVCVDRSPAWYRVVSGQVRTAGDTVSVIMTVHNAAETLDAAIDSIVEQSYRRLELIIVDDGSTDGSLDIARRRMMHDGRIRLLQTPANSGTYVAKNVGLAHATGDMVTFQDSDDVSLSHRIELQVAALHSDPRAMANMVRYQRFSHETGRVLWVSGRKDRPGVMTPMFRRQPVLDAIGSFDSVRVSADSEFIARLTAATGIKPQVLPTVGYLARHKEGSLTTAGPGAIKLSPDGAATLPPARVAYWAAATEWHQEIAAGTASPYVAFPPRTRPFPAAAEILPGSWIDGHQMVTASMATMPQRVDLLAQSVASLLPQVDRLRVYLNNFDEVPAFLDHPKISVARSQDHGDLKDNGKFFAVDQVPEGYHFTVDDDIIYPPDYVQKSILTIEKYDRRVAVGVHGVNLADPLVRYTQGRWSAHFRRALPRDELVQMLGTGTLAYHTSTLKVDFDQFLTTGVADLWFAIQARRKGVGLLAQQRPANWLQAIVHDGERIFDRAVICDENETAIAREHGPWTADGMAEVWRPLAHHVVARRRMGVLSTMGYNINQLAALLGQPPVNFTLIVPGWNCADHVRACWDSIAQQRPGHYTREVYLVDDASTDGTWEALSSLPVDSDVHLIRHEENRGPAYARYEVLQRITSPQQVCVLLDLDDELMPDALWKLAEVYLGDPRVWMTSGNWHDQDRRPNPLEFYDRSVVERRAYRDVPLFKCTHLRSFRRFLADPLGPEHFHDPAGDGWLMHCSDVALLLPMLEQCAAENIVYLHDKLYRYRRGRESGTIRRFGKDSKNATYRALCSMPRQPARSGEDATQVDSGVAS